MALTRLVSAAPSHIRHHVVSLKSNGRLEQEIRAKGVQITTLDVKGARNFGSAITGLRRALKTQRPDVIVTWLYHADLLGSLANLLTTRTPLIWNVRCADMDLSKYSAMTRTLPRLLARLSGLPSVIITNSNAGRRAHEAYGYRARGWQIIPNGFDISTFRPDDQTRLRMRKALKIDATTPLIGLIARVDPMKDHETFLLAAAKVASFLPSARFLLAGRGTDNLDFSKTIAARGLPTHRFLLLGERLDVPEILTTLDLAVSSSRTEGFSNSIAEAMATGVPCVVTDVGDSAAIVGDTGRVVPKESPDDLARAMIEILTLPEDERARLSTAARERISRNFALEATNQQYADVFAKVING